MDTISTSLWGDKDKYCLGAIRNAELWPKFFPEWEFRVYHDDSVPPEIIQRLSALGAKLIKKESYGSFSGMFWRFEVNDDPTVGRYMIRDLDSRFSNRERVAVDQWTTSRQPFHIIRDHPHHRRAMLGGLWGGTTGYFQIDPMIKQWKRYGHYDCDQQMLETLVWPRVKSICYVNDSLAGVNPLPPNADKTHLGQIFEGDDTPVWR